MRSRSWFAAAALVALGCSSKGSSPTVASVSAPSDLPPLLHGTSIDKVDLLFMIDNSSSMGDKQALLGSAVPDLLNRFVNPLCLDDAGNVLGSSNNGACASGHAEFTPVHDLHVGVVSSSLGGRGSTSCPADASNPTNPALSTHNDDQAHLLTRGGVTEVPVADAVGMGFLTLAPGGDSQKLVADFQQLVTGVAQYGCGYEAQMESWYRFLVQPDPYASLGTDPTTGVVSLQGTDATVLKERHDFLRPDSLVAIISLTDENDSTVDPMTLGGQGAFYEDVAFPGSTTGGGVPSGTSACATHPFDPSCTSCGFCAYEDPQPTTAAICADPSCSGSNHGYDDLTADGPDIRFFHMQQRFGIDPQFPVERYIHGLSHTLVPDRNGEHPVDPTTGLPSPSYVGTEGCTNPLFAASLPTDPTADLCHLPLGARSADMVVFAVIGGVSPSLLHYDASKLGSATLTDADWTKLLGNDPLHYDFTGVDPHMLESSTPRAGLPAPTASDTADPVNGREWNTQGNDLEYSCDFDLATPKDCTAAENQFACDCPAGLPPGDVPPICDPTTPTTQIRGKAYPPVRELAVARALGSRAAVGSICSLHATPADALAGYRPAVRAIGDRISSVLVAP